MDFLKNLFGTTEPEVSQTKIAWNMLTDLGQLNQIVAESEIKPVLIFKHSTTCSISRMALKNFENEFNLQGSLSLYLLDLLNHRAISNEIGIRFAVVHQSPQILLIQNGQAVYNTSHENIDASILKEKIVD